MKCIDRFTSACRATRFVTLLCAAVMASVSVSYACENHGPGFGMYPMGSHARSAPTLSEQLARGMILSAEPRFTVNASEVSQVPFSITVPDNFEQAKVTWKADDIVNLQGAKDQAVGTGADQQLLLNIAPGKTGIFVLRGKLTANVAGQTVSKFRSIFVKVTSAEEKLAVAN
ncbi:hypothetical protein [Ferrimonas lipolytica]|uniref:Uncharacterized protein n=1 Tax=Ferrimonas lipolytica TaxID=2724191 RepID=A0A6H1UAU5_9GAMM|nr:hypothetical protein [Ferrimonas lipolytica]QIZ76197.1 hypothetical protein HER31_04380 [Ferrimonas lipolytica]